MTLSLGAEVWGYSLEPEYENNLFNRLGLDKKKPESLPGNLNHCVGDIRDLEGLKRRVEAFSRKLFCSSAWNVVVIEILCLHGPQMFKDHCIFRGD